jgi:hypothetical protein
MTLPTDYDARKAIPLATGLLDYFPDALAEVARVSKAGNDQHNAGEPLHWARGKSTDEAHTLIRHFLERGGVDTDGQRHTAKMVWRALALLQKELEEAHGYPLPRGCWPADAIPYVLATPRDTEAPIVFENCTATESPWVPSVGDRVRSTAQDYHELSAVGFTGTIVDGPDGEGDYVVREHGGGIRERWFKASALQPDAPAPGDASKPTP